MGDVDRAEIDQLVAARTAARARKDFAESDRIRDGPRRAGHRPRGRSSGHDVAPRVRRRAVVATLLLALATPLRAEPVALTFDDLPVFGEKRSVAEETRITRRLLAGLVRHHLPAIGFVNELNLEPPERAAKVALLARWLDAGMDLGNHGFSHLSLTTTPVDAYIADTARGDVVTKALLADRGRQELWFRYPYLETGPTLAVRRTFEDWLAGAGYRVAPVTVENADYRFADAYDVALDHGDRRRARAVRREYIDYTGKIVAWYRSAGLALLGRRPGAGVAAPRQPLERRQHRRARPRHPPPASDRGGRWRRRWPTRPTR